MSCYNKSTLDDPTILTGAYWAELRIFLGLAKCSSMSAAANLLNISQPTISRAIRYLEDKLGSQLVIISNKGVQLTTRGREFANILARLDYELLQAGNDLQHERTDIAGTVRISITDGLCGFFVAPALPDFGKLYPNVQLHIKPPLNIHQVRENMMDVIATFAPPQGADITVARAGTLNLIPVASHDYITRFGMPTLDNLQDHCFVDSDVYSGQDPVWQPWQALLKRGRVLHSCESSFSYGLMVKSGIGIGLLGNYTIADPVSVPVNLGVQVALPISIVALNERLKSKPVQVAFQWLQQVLGPKVAWLANKGDPYIVPDMATRQIVSQLISTVDHVRHAKEALP